MTLAKIAALAFAAALSIGATTPQTLPGRDWNRAVAVTAAGGHLLGNPAAEVKLVEFVSYTCPHCSAFEKAGGSALQVGYVASGKVSVEVRHLVRDPVDLTVALLTNCGNPSRFFGNHALFLRGQDKWIPRMSLTGPAFQQRWTTGDFATRMRAIATDFGFYAMMASRGYDRPTVDRCLADEGKGRRLAEMTQAAIEAGVKGTPSFLVDGALSDAHDWRGLETELRARLKRS